MPANLRYKEFLKTPDWQEVRKVVLERACHRCQICNSPESLAIHHRTYERTGGEELLSDLTVLCKTCHALFHRVGKGKKKPVVKLHKDGKKKDEGENALKKAKASKPTKDKAPRKYVVFYVDGRRAITTLTPEVMQMLQQDPDIRSIRRTS